MLLGYNTNGLAHHSLPSALELLSELGYRSVAITLDHAALNPYAAGFERELQQIGSLLRELNLRSVIETGARYLLDPRQKHEPTLVSARHAGRPRRVEFLRHAIDIAAALRSDCVSLWSGVLPPGDSEEVGFSRLAESLTLVLDYANRHGVRLGFEPEPGMLIDTMAKFETMLQHVDSPFLKLTLDIGHLQCQGELPLEDAVRRWSDRLVNVHIEDMRRGRHEHLMFGEGEIRFPPVLGALAKCQYTGPVHVELSRHSHVGPQAARQAFEFLQPLITSAATSGGP